MKKKIFILDTYYENFLQSLYSKNTNLRDLSYQKQKQIIINQQFGLSDFYSRNLEKQGFEAEEFIINNKLLQIKWAEESNVSFRNNLFGEVPLIRKFILDNNREKILLAQLEELN